MSSASAVAVLSAVATGMMALTGVVFALLTVGLQFGSTAYSPRLVHVLGQHRLVPHALGVFTGTFLYAVLAIGAVDHAGNPGVSAAVVWLGFAWLVASVVMLAWLLPGVYSLSAGRVLRFLGDRGREEIARWHPAPKVGEPAALPPVVQVVRHAGAPMHLCAPDARRLVALAHAAGAVIRVPRAVGDTLVAGAPLALVLGGTVPERRLRAAIPLAPLRGLRGDPAFAVRLLVDIAIRALSPAVNDPTTAVDALDEIHSLLRMFAERPEGGRVADAAGALRLVYATPTWEDLLRLGLAEIQHYGRDSPQVERRLSALLRDLAANVPAPRRDAVERFAARHAIAIDTAFGTDVERAEAGARDWQGLGHTWEET
jgi:uncharacterized membrane protein